MSKRKVHSARRRLSGHHGRRTNDPFRSAMPRRNGFKPARRKLTGDFGWVRYEGFVVVGPLA